MNRNEKEKPARIEIRVRPKVKEKIQKMADRCGLSVSEYMVKRALGYEPRAVPPETFFSCYQVLCQLVNRQPSPETEKKLLDVIEQMQLALLPGKENLRDWLQQDSGPSGKV